MMTMTMRLRVAAVIEVTIFERLSQKESPVDWNSVITANRYTMTPNTAAMTSISCRAQQARSGQVRSGQMKS